MSDAWLIIGIFVFAFILWAATGGPNRPISFAGPYLTPINTVGDIETGGTGGSSWWNSTGTGGNNGGGSWGNGNLEEWGEVSPFSNQVQISSGASGPAATSVSAEYVSIRATSGASDVDVTGWKVISMETGATATIPQAQIIARQGGSANVMLKPSHEVVMSTGSSPLGSSFRENTCIGYAAQGRTFTPSLRNSCPTALDELGNFFEGDAAAYNECRDAVSSFGRCTVPESPRGVSSRCRAFISDRLNYAGCVRVHQADADFYGNNWRVYLGSRTELWRTDNETLRLVDREGRTVDVYTY
jgi:hypothetical protein